MKDIIKDRIEKIENNIVPQGYKKTEIGIIPEDWKVEKLEEVAKKNGIVRGPFGSSLKKEFFISSGYKIYQQGNAIKKDIRLGEYYIDEKKYNELNRFAIKKGDFIISCSGTIGRIFEIPEKFEPGVINQALLKLSLDSQKINNSYFINLFRSIKFQTMITENTQGGAMKNLVGMKVFKKTKVILPPLKEQEKIASILSTWDQYIENIDSIIESKKNQKKGLMQNLLTGEVRLPGFNGEWKEVKLGDVLKVQGGYAFKSNKFKKYGIPIIRISNINNNVDIDKDIVYYNDIEIDKKFEIEKNDLLIAMSGATTGKVGLYKIDRKAYLNQRVGKFVPDLETLTKNYMNQIIKSYIFQSELKTLLSVGAQPNISSSDIEKIEINLPPIDEQVAIASVLSSADREIELLEDLRNKRMEEKKGLMQLLLTGIVRVGG